MLLGKHNSLVWYLKWNDLTRAKLLKRRIQWTPVEV